MNRHLSVPALLIATTMIAFGSSVAPAIAKADKRPCVTSGEYHQIKNRQTLGHVQQVFDSKGKVLFQNHGAVTNGAREFRSCKESGLGATVQIQYNNYAAHGGPFRVVNIENY